MNINRLLQKNINRCYEKKKWVLTRKIQFYNIDYFNIEKKFISKDRYLNQQDTKSLIDGSSTQTTPTKILTNINT